MKSMKLLSVFVIAIAVTAALSGCGENTAARNTAEAVLGTIFVSRASSPEEKALLMATPEYKQALGCLINHLDQSGWDSDAHDFFMTETRGTGNVKMIDTRKFSEAEQMKHFGAILTSSCF